MELSRGDKGPDVERLQAALQRAGFDVDVDGDFGAQTARAVEDFQAERGLTIDGVAGPDTLAALGLAGGDPEGQQRPPVTDIEFEAGEEVLPPQVAEHIAQLVQNLQTATDQILQSAEQAVDNFETTMQFSTNDPQASVPRALMADVLRALGDQVIELVSTVVPTFDQAIEFAGGLFGTVADNLAKGAAAAERNEAGAWIRSQRRVLDAARTTYSGEEFSASLRGNLEADYLGADDRVSMFDGIFEAESRLRVDPLPTIADFELRLYENWINAHFVGLGEDASGCIEFRYKFDDMTFDFVSCTVEAPYGSSVEAGLNELFRDDLVPSTPRPIDLWTRKRAAFLVDNVNPGGKSWRYGWLDEQGNELSRPFDDAAEQAFDQPIWRNQARFVRAAD